MNKQEEKPVPRAERKEGKWAIYFNSMTYSLLVEEDDIIQRNPRDQYRGFHAGHLQALIESAKLREKLAANREAYESAVTQGIALRREIEELEAGGNRVAAELGLPEGSGVDEVIGRIAEMKWRLGNQEESLKTMLAAKDTLTEKGMDAYIDTIKGMHEGRKSICRELGIAEDSGVDEVIGRIKEIKELSALRQADESKANHAYIKLRVFMSHFLEVSGLPSHADEDQARARASAICRERSEALQQIENLGKFIGHPGATPAHVVSETMSLVHKLMRVAHRGFPELLASLETNLSRHAEVADSYSRDHAAVAKQPPACLKVICHALEIDEGSPVSRIVEEIDRRESKGRARASLEQATIGMQPDQLVYGSGIPGMLIPKGRGNPSQEIERLKAMRDDTSLDRETRRQAAYACQAWDFILNPDWATIAPSECLERGLPMLAEDEADYRAFQVESGQAPCGS